jgi:pimeloyl-ACP methyl ester carboxylesterase
MRIVHGLPPTATGTHHGLAWASFVPKSAPHGVVLVLHGADSVKENQFDFARAAATAGLLAVAFDARGHGASGGVLGATAIDDVLAMADLARGMIGDPQTPLGLRGSSMGGFFALACAAGADADAVVAICPAGGAQLRAGLESGRFAFPCDREALTDLLGAHDLHEDVRHLDAPLLLMHARGDLQVPVEHSQELAALAPQCRYVEMPGGPHQSIQHDAELLGISVRFLSRALQAAGRS